jgi:hypothetical protein
MCLFICLHMYITWKWLEFLFLILLQQIILFCVIFLDWIFVFVIDLNYALVIFFKSGKSFVHIYAFTYWSLILHYLDSVYNYTSLIYLI